MCQIASVGTEERDKSPDQGYRSHYTLACIDDGHNDFLPKPIFGVCRVLRLDTFAPATRLGNGNLGVRVSTSTA